MPFDGHNGNRGQLNPEILLYSYDGAFINHALTMQQFSAGAVLPSPVKMNAQGLPIDLSDGSWSTVWFNPWTASYTGDWVIDWVGSMTCTAGVASTTTGSLTGVNGKWEGKFTASAGRTFTITAIDYPANPLTRIRIYRKDHEALLNAGEIFTPQFLAKCRKAGVLRMDLNWQFMNFSNVALWSDRAPIDHFSYACSYFKPSLCADGTAVTSHSGDAYTVAKTGFTLTDKAKIHLVWDFTNTTTTPSLDVQSTGAKVIKRATASAAIAGTCTINKRETLTYDKGLDCWLVSGNQFDEGIQGRVPPEIILALNNKCRTHPMLIIPHMACEFQSVSDASDKIGGITDYTAGLAALHRDGLFEGGVPRYSASNEIFNSICLPYNYANARSLSRHGAGGYNKQNEWEGRALSLIGAALQTAYSGSGKSYKLLCDVQSAGSPDITSVRDTRMECPLHVAAGGNPASNYVTDICLANYWVARAFSPSQSWTTFSRLIADSWAAWGASQGTKDALVHAIYYDPVGGAQNFFDDVGIVRLTTWNNCAQHYGVGTTYYEGGNSPDGITANPRMRVLGISKATQAVVTMDSGHPMRTGMKTLFKNITGMTEINLVTATVLSYTNTTFTIDVDTTGFTTFISGDDGTQFSTSDINVRGCSFGGDGTTTGRDIVNSFRNVYRKHDDAEVFTRLNLEQAISLPGCHSPSQFDLSGDGAWSAHDGSIDNPLGAWRGFVDFSENLPAGYLGKFILGAV